MILKSSIHIRLRNDLRPKRLESMYKGILNSKEILSKHPLISNVKDCLYFDGLISIKESKTDKFIEIAPQLRAITMQLLDLANPSKKIQNMIKKTLLIGNISSMLHTLNPSYKLFLINNKDLFSLPTSFIGQLQASLIEAFEQYSLNNLMMLTCYMFSSKLSESNSESYSKIIERIFQLIESKPTIQLKNSTDPIHHNFLHNNSWEQSQMQISIMKNNFIAFLHAIFQTESIDATKKLALLTYILTDEKNEYIVAILMNSIDCGKIDAKISNILISMPFTSSFRIEYTQNYLTFCAFISKIIAKQSYQLKQKSSEIEQKKEFEINERIQSHKLLILDVIDRLILLIESTTKIYEPFLKILSWYLGKTVTQIALILSTSQIFVEKTWQNVLSLTKHDFNGQNLFKIFQALCCLQSSKLPKHVYMKFVQKSKNQLSKTISQAYVKLSISEKMSFISAMLKNNEEMFTRQILPFLPHDQPNNNQKHQKQGEQIQNHSYETTQDDLDSINETKQAKRSRQKSKKELEIIMTQFKDIMIQFTKSMNQFIKDVKTPEAELKKSANIMLQPQTMMTTQEAKPKMSMVESENNLSQDEEKIKQLKKIFAEFRKSKKLFNRCMEQFKQSLVKPQKLQKQEYGIISLIKNKSRSQENDLTQPLQIMEQLKRIMLPFKKQIIQFINQIKQLKQSLEQTENITQKPQPGIEKLQKLFESARKYIRQPSKKIVKPQSKTSLAELKVILLEIKESQVQRKRTMTELEIILKPEKSKVKKTKGKSTSKKTNGQPVWFQEVQLDVQRMTKQLENDKKILKVKKIQKQLPLKQNKNQAFIKEHLAKFGFKA